MSSLGFAPLSSSGPNPGQCFTTPDPQYAREGAPARMADGRLFTDFRPTCSSYPVAACGTWGDNETRERMTHGATELMNAGRSMISAKVDPASCVDTMVPELYRRVCTWKGCKTIPGHFAGIGTGRVYVESAANQDPETSSRISVPVMPGTFPRMGLGTPTNCSVPGGNEIHPGGRAHFYSAPRI